MKKWSVALLAVILLWNVTMQTAFASVPSYSWYCVHTKGHLQPQIDQSLAFVETHRAFYADHRHSDPRDSDKVIYLTFDVGYENGNVARVLDTLKEKDVQAAFFILGHLINQNTDLVQRMAEEGHEVCNHTVHHKNMSRVDNNVFLAELHSLEALYTEKTGKQMEHFYRPPEGRFSEQNLICAAENGYDTIFWSFAYPDWDNNRQMSSEKAQRVILENAHNGEVMLLHPTSETNAKILGDVIDLLRADGYRFGTLKELTSL